MSSLCCGSAVDRPEIETNLILPIAVEEETVNGKEAKIVFSLFCLSNKEREELKIPFLLPIKCFLSEEREEGQVTLFVTLFDLIFSKRIDEF